VEAFQFEVDFEFVLDADGVDDQADEKGGQDGESQESD